MIATLFWRVTQLGGALLSIAIILGWFQDFHLAFDSLSHFRLIFCLFLTIPALILLLGHRWRSGGTFFAIVAISVLLTWPYLPQTGTQPSVALSKRDVTLRVVQMNLRFNNPTPQKAVLAIRSGNPDIILLQEVTAKTQSALAALSNTHPYHISCQSRSWGSVGILSRYPFAKKYATGMCSHTWFCQRDR